MRYMVPMRKRDSRHTHASWLRTGCMPLHRSHRRARDIGMSTALGGTGLPLQGGSTRNVEQAAFRCKTVTSLYHAQLQQRMCH
jgi:hypothetical protein